MGDFTISRTTAFDMVQDYHNSCEESGTYNEDLTIEAVCEGVADMFADWLRENIDWEQLRHEDELARDEAAEYQSAMEGRY